MWKGEVERMKIILRHVSKPIEEKHIEINKVGDIAYLIKEHNEYIIFRIYDNKLEAIVFDGYVAHGKWNTKQQSMEVMDCKREINTLTNRNDKLKDIVKEYANRFKYKKWKDKDGKFTYSMEITKRKIKKKKEKGKDENNKQEGNI